MASTANQKSSGREAALARRHTLSSLGKRSSGASSAPERTRTKAPAAPAPVSRRPAATPVMSQSAPPPARLEIPARRTQPAAAPLTSSSRAEARARRAALSKAGKRADRSADRTRAQTPTPKTEPRASTGKSKECQCGCGGDPRRQTLATEVVPSLGARSSLTASNTASNGTRRNGNGSGKRALVAKPTGRLLALARRSAQSGRGKAGINPHTTTASLARQANPDLSGRDLAQRVRAQRSNAGSAGTRRTQPTGRVRPGRERPVGGAEDQPWKVGLSETAQGQLVTGTKVGRSRTVTGDEPSSCREITGTEYMGAEIFREFCQAEPAKPVAKVRVTTTSAGLKVTGNELGRSTKVTGDEPGTCKNVTGTEYLSAEQSTAFCATPPSPNPRRTGRTQTLGGQPVSGVMVGLSSKVTGNEQGAGARPTGSQYLSDANGNAPDPTRVPPKVGVTKTLGGGTLTGTQIGHSAKVTGDEPGSCRLITGDEYIGSEQYRDFCKIEPKPLEAPKVGYSATRKGLTVSGTQTGRSNRVTGDEPGTCKAVTGTPYAGLEQAEAYCEPERLRAITERIPPLTARGAQRMTGSRPGIGGVVTGASRGACEDLTGTPYLGAEQVAEHCSGALPGQPDFPQPLEGAPWQSFSVASPARQAFQARQTGAVTGTRYEQEGRITGPFGMGTGKITGTEQFRFDRGSLVPENLLEMAPTELGEGTESAPLETARSRITGEGQAAGAKITGDDWERGDRVTGTEGPSARRRNPTRPGPMSVMAELKRKRNEEIPAPVSRVTGSSGNTERGSLITYSGGARG